MQHDSHVTLRILVAYHAEKVARPAPTRTAEEILAEIEATIAGARG